MGRVTGAWCGVVLAVAALAAAEERLAVLEFFGRPTGGYCQAAGPAMVALQGEMAGRAVLLEYDVDAYGSGRVDRWAAAHPQGGWGTYLPWVMVGSGFMISSAPASYYDVYRSMLEAELERVPQARVEAYSSRTGQTLRVYVRVTNTGVDTLWPENALRVWVVLWEDARLGVSDTWVQATGSRALTAPLAPGATATVTVDLTPSASVVWSRARSVALLEHRPPGDHYDMLQAALAGPVTFAATPAAVSLSATQPTAAVSLEGPFMLGWSATADVPWLEVTPSSGGTPGEATLALRPGAVPPGQSLATVRFDATGDGLALSATVEVSAEGPADPYAPRRVRGRVGLPGREVERP